MKKLIILAISTMHINALHLDTKYLIVNTPITDQRTEPEIRDIKLGHSGYSDDPKQETQLLYGEYVIASSQTNDFLFVSAIEQNSHGYVHKKFLKPTTFIQKNIVTKKLYTPVYSEPNKDIKTGLIKTGLIKTGLTKTGLIMFEIPLGSSFAANKIGHWYQLIGVDGYVKEEDVRDLNDKTEVRKNIAETAKLFLGQRYTWGGNTPHNPKLKQLTGVDCSGLAYICYKSSGINIPRDSKVQYRYSQHIQTGLISGNELKLGDLIFLSKKGSPETILHVMIYLGNDTFIDSYGLDTNCVRITTGTKFLNKPLEEIENGERIGQFTVFFGTYCS